MLNMLMHRFVWTWNFGAGELSVFILFGQPEVQSVRAVLSQYLLLVLFYLAVYLRRFLPLFVVLPPYLPLYQSIQNPHFGI